MDESIIVAKSHFMDSPRSWVTDQSKYFPAASLIYAKTSLSCSVIMELISYRILYPTSVCRRETSVDINRLKKSTTQMPSPTPLPGYSKVNFSYVRDYSK